MSFSDSPPVLVFDRLVSPEGDEPAGLSDSDRFALEAGASVLYEMPGGEQYWLEPTERRRCGPGVVRYVRATSPHPTGRIGYFRYVSAEMLIGFLCGLAAGLPF